MLLCVDGKECLYFLQEFRFPARLLLRVRTCSYNNQSNSQNSLDIIETLKHTTEHSREKLDLEAAQSGFSHTALPTVPTIFHCLNSLEPLVGRLRADISLFLFQLQT